jgi:hypothetical protein
MDYSRKKILNTTLLEMNRYKDLIELGVSDDEAKSWAAGLGDPWTDLQDAIIYR